MGIRKSKYIFIAKLTCCATFLNIDTDTNLITCFMTFHYFLFKDYVAARNKTGRLQDVKGLFQDAREKADEKGIWPLSGH